MRKFLRHPTFLTLFLCLSLGAWGCGKFTPIEISELGNTGDSQVCDENTPCDNQPRQGSALLCEGGLANGEQELRIRFEKAIVNADELCKQENQNRTCNDGKFGEWSGAYEHETCLISTPGFKNCSNIVHGASESRTRFAAATVPNGQTCQSQTQTRTCTNGVFSNWSGTYAQTSCQVLPPVTTTPKKSCSGVAHGGSQTRIKYQSSTVPFGQSCQSQTQARTCNDGIFSTWTGSYTFDSCVVLNQTGVQKIFANNFRKYCALLANGKTKCWGTNGSGEWGSGDKVAHTTPQEVSFSSTPVDIDGNSHSCGVFADSTVKCWGLNNRGQLGIGTQSTGTETAVVAQSLVTGLQAKAIAGGSRHTCALLTNNTVKCWGDNSNGATGIGLLTGVSTTPQTTISTAVKALAYGWEHGCAIMNDDSVRCWGQNRNGAVGNGTTVNSSRPVTVANLKAKQISLGQSHSCAITLTNQIACWGSNFSGQLGNGTTTSSNTPVILSNLSAKHIYAGANFNCAILTDDSVKCWGANGSGQLGINATGGSRTSPAVVPNLKAKDLAGGNDSMCAINLNNQLMCWGANTSRQLGLGDTSPRYIPTIIPLN